MIHNDFFLMHLQLLYYNRFDKSGKNRGGGEEDGKTWERRQREDNKQT